MSKLPVRDGKGQHKGEFDLPDGLLVFDKGLTAMHDAVLVYRAHQRSGQACTKTKSEVSGSGKKPWRQKGLGRARSGYRASPVWRGGGVAMGPRPRDFNVKLTRKSARLAFRRAFSEQVAAGHVEMLDELTLAEPKTRLLAALIGEMKLTGRVLILVDQVGETLKLAARNMPKVTVQSARDVNTYEMLRHAHVLITRDGMQELTKRLQPQSKGEQA